FSPSTRMMLSSASSKPSIISSTTRSGSLINFFICPLLSVQQRTASRLFDHHFQQSWPPGFEEHCQRRIQSINCLDPLRSNTLAARESDKINVVQPSPHGFL